MRDFIPQLEQQLIGAARAEARRGRATRFARSMVWLPTRSAAAIAGAAAAVVLAVLVGFPSSSSPSLALAYPVLAKPATDASAVVKRIPPAAREILVAAGATPRQARAISTPWGTGYALPAKNGESLSKTALNVPGGLLGIKCEEIKGEGLAEKFFRGLCKETLEKGITQVTATTELVANAKNPVLFNEFWLIREEETALTLPLRVHLKNPLLGNNCYIGSEASPLQLHLTTGTTKPPAGFTPLKGAAGTLEVPEEKGLTYLKLVKNSLVDNTFPSPGTEGCGEFLFFKGLLDGLVNGKLKIPNKAGENSAVLDGELNSASPRNVILSESF